MENTSFWIFGSKITENPNDGPNPVGDLVARLQFVIIIRYLRCKPMQLYRYIYILIKASSTMVRDRESWKLPDTVVKNMGEARFLISA